MSEPKGPNMTWERITVRRVPPDSFIGEARLHAHFAIGSICKDPSEAMQSAEQAMVKLLGPLKAKTQAKKARVVTPDLDDLL